MYFRLGARFPYAKCLSMEGRAKLNFEVGSKDEVIEVLKEIKPGVA